MEEEEKETSGKAIICLKVHLLCYFFIYFDLLLEWKNTRLLESYVYVMKISFLSLGIFLNLHVTILFLDLCFANPLSIKYNYSLLASNTWDCIIFIN